MPIENATYISQLDPNNPQGNVRKVLEGDDELRQLKSVLQNTFPNANGAINPTPAEFNILVGATITTAQLNRLGGLGGTASRAVVTDSSGNLSESSVTSTELGYLSGATSNIQGQIDNILPSAASGNLLPNSDFEVDDNGDGVPNGWDVTTYSGGSQSLDTSTFATGSKSVKFTSTSVANGGGYLLSANYIPAYEGDVFELSYLVKAANTGVSHAVQFYFYDSAGTLIDSANTTQLSDTPTSWTRFSLVARAPANAAKLKIIMVGGYPNVGASTGSIWFDNVMLLRQHVRETPEWLWSFDSGGLGFDAQGTDLNYTTNTTLTDNFISCRTFTVQSGVTVTTAGLLVVRARRSITIYGTINGKGLGAAGGASDTAGADGLLGGGGGGGGGMEFSPYTKGKNGGYGLYRYGYGAGGRPGSSAPAITSSALNLFKMFGPMPMIDFSSLALGGGGGGGGANGGSAGGAGGAFVMLVAPTIQLIGGHSINVSGNNGGACGADYGAGGGGGGGCVALIYQYLSGTPNAVLTGGSAGSCSNSYRRAGNGASGQLIQVQV